MFALVSPVAVLGASALAAGILQVMGTRVPNHAEIAATAAVIVFMISISITSL